MYKTRVDIITCALFICLYKALFNGMQTLRWRDSWFCLVVHFEVSEKLLTNFSEYQTKLVVLSPSALLLQWHSHWSHREWYMSTERIQIEILDYKVSADSTRFLDFSKMKGVL